MQTVLDTLRLCPKALLLESEAYEEMRASASPLVKGLILIVVVGVLISLVGIVGETLEWATTPSFDEMQEIVWQGMEEMPWVQQIPLEERRAVMEIIRQRYDFGWRIARLFAPNPLNAALKVIAIPILLLIGWFIYSLLAHLFAKLLGGQASFGQTFGCTALAVSPQLLNLANLLPYVKVGVVVWAWMLVCNYLALKIAHRFDTGRAFWAAILPLIVLALLAAALVAIGVAIASALIGGR